MTISRVMAEEIWRGLDPAWRLDALMGCYASESHPAHNVHVLAQEIIAYRAEELTSEINVSEALAYCLACEERAGIIPPVVKQ